MKKATKSTPPIALLKEFRRGFEAEAKNFRGKEKAAMTLGEMRAMGAAAYANEQAVKKIDATLRDWT